MTDAALQRVRDEVHENVYRQLAQLEEELTEATYTHQGWCDHWLSSAWNRFMVYKAEAASQQESE